LTDQSYFVVDTLSYINQVTSFDLIVATQTLSSLTPGESAVGPEVQTLDSDDPAAT
jgi:hypothetical protein